MTDPRPRCPLCKKLHTGVCAKCQQIVRALFKPEKEAA